MDSGGDVRAGSWRLLRQENQTLAGSPSKIWQSSLPELVHVNDDGVVFFERQNGRSVVEDDEIIFVYGNYITFYWQAE